MTLSSFFGGLFKPATPAPASAEKPTYSIQPAAEDLIISFEQSGKCALEPYLDPVGIPTQGYGSIWNWRAGPNVHVTMADAPITEAVAREWLANEMAGVLDALKADLTVPITDNQEAALEDFIYNLGAGNFGASTLLKKLNAHDVAGAAAEFAKWDLAKGVLLPGLERRRAAEKALFLK